MSASPSFKTKSARGLRWIVSAAVINPKSAVRSSFWEGAGALGACVHQDMSPLAGPTHEADWPGVRGWCRGILALKNEELGSTSEFWIYHDDLNQDMVLQRSWCPSMAIFVNPFRIDPQWILFGQATLDCMKSLSGVLYRAFMVGCAWRTSS